MIRFQINAPVDPGAVAKLFGNSGIRRPHDDLPRIAQMLEYADLTVTAWEGGQLVGVPVR